MCLTMLWTIPALLLSTIVAASPIEQVVFNGNSSSPRPLVIW